MTCPKCGAPMDDAKTVRWAFHEWLVCPGCDTYVKPSYFDGLPDEQIALEVPS